MANNRSLISCLVLISSFLNVAGQPYGNEWIEPNQIYFKFKIGETGIYRILRSDLVDGGFPVGSIDPRRIQLFHRGAEQAIRISGQSDGIFDENDFIEFYGRQADGSSDTPLYVSANAQPHTFYNLFSDSSAYFLTYKLNLENGLRIQNFFENNVDNLPAESYVSEHVTLLNTTVYSAGRSSGSGGQVLLGSYDYAEGWTGTFQRQARSLDFTVNGLENGVLTAPPPRIAVLVTGGNNNNHNVSIQVGPDAANLRQIGVAQFSGYNSEVVSSVLQWTDIAPNGSLLLRANVNGVDGAADRAAISYIDVEHHTLDFENALTKTFELLPNTNNKSFVRINNQGSASVLYDITDQDRPLSIGFNISGNQLTAIVNSTSVARQLFVQTGYKNIGSIRQVSFDLFDPSQFNYLIVTSARLRGETTDGQGDQVLAYKAYRESVAGGSHSVLISNVEDVFNQFNYGEPSPLAIRRMCEYIYDNGSPEFLFIIGKGSRIASGYYRQHPDTANVRHFVPTFGQPGADVPFSSGFDGGIGYETIATGRINADSPDDIQAYLNKVIEEEALPFESLRQKKLVHLSGGNSESELDAFRGYITDFSDAAKKKWLGGESVQISKNNNSAVELINISDEINEGAMMVTFFGHSSGAITDIEIGLVSDPSFGYANKGKYPVFMVNGCQAGDFLGENESFGVDWILTPDLGALAFMAHSHVGFSNTLWRYTNDFYLVGFNESEFITKSVGEIKKEASRRFITQRSPSTTNIAQVQLVNLQGDPAVKIFGADKPDLSLDENLISFHSFDGNPIMAASDSFYIEFNVKNFGIGTDSLMSVQVERTLPNGTSVSYGPIVYEPTLREDTLQFVIYNETIGGAGLNSFRIAVDPFGQIDEMSVTNNQATAELFMTDGSTINLIPSPYGVVSDQNVLFTFQSSNILVDERSYDFQLDTVKTFNSPLLVNQTLSTHTVGRINMDLSSLGNIPDNTVFYWRTRYTDPEPQESDQWETSSFTYSSSQSEGWSQQRPAQLNELSLDGMQLEESTGLWEFISTSINLNINTYGAAHPTFDYLSTTLELNGQDYFNTSSNRGAAICTNNTINFLAFKRQSALPFRPINFTQSDELNGLVCGRLPQVILNYEDRHMNWASGPNTYIDLLENGDKVLIYSLGNVTYSAWSDSFKTRMESLGINRDLLDNLVDGEPVIFIGAKGAEPNTAVEIRALSVPANQAQLSHEQVITGNFDSGKITSNLIGPSTQWGNLRLELLPSANPDDDQNNLMVVAVDAQGNESILYQDEAVMDLDLGETGLNLDPGTFPFVRLELSLEDQSQFTPSQLKSWSLQYQEAPELVLLKRDQTDTEATNVVQEGEGHTASFTIWNVSNKNITDSVAINFDLFNSSNAVRSKDSLMTKPLVAGDSVQFNSNIKTLGKTGQHDLIVQANRYGVRERTLANNNLRIADYLEVEADQTNPILNVTFDGIAILNGDIVSSNPRIRISLEDENTYILKEDTLGINFYMKPPCEICDYQRVPFSSAEVIWQPADTDRGFEIEFTPSELEDGIHSLRVQAQDGSGNNSGLQPYEISFEVINQSTITNFYPYPNPFSSSTQFVFTLTGSVLPEDLKIQIMTVSGRIVREIFMDELGTIRIGHNKTQFAWNGTDQYGDWLANGVYLYRVMLKEPGGNFEHRETAGDRGFKNGFGKLYLLR